MVRHSFVIDKPSLVTGTLGGAAGAVLFACVLYVAPVAGAAFLDLPRLVGWIFSADEATALWVGFWLLFLVGWLFLPLVLSGVWELLPGDRVTFRGALARGVVFGAALWLVAGLLLPLLSGLGRAGSVQDPGFFGLQLGLGAAAALLVASLGYGLVAALIAAMAQGLAPIDALGWEGHGAGRAA